MVLIGIHYVVTVAGHGEFEIAFNNSLQHCGQNSDEKIHRDSEKLNGFSLGRHVVDQSESYVGHRRPTEGGE
jgi:hypothetical protein